MNIYEFCPAASSAADIKQWHKTWTWDIHGRRQRSGREASHLPSRPGLCHPSCHPKSKFQILKVPSWLLDFKFLLVIASMTQQQSKLMVQAAYWPGG